LLIERYVPTARPSARARRAAARIDLSPATIRNVMADLEELGFVCSPHTSAGRIPTNRGYRYFVDALLAPETIREEARNRIIEELGGARTANDLVQAASSLLSQLTHMAGVVTVRAAISRCSGGSSSCRCPTIACRDPRGQPARGANRVLQMSCLRRDELERYANAINEQFAGRDLVAAARAARRSRRAQTG